MKLKEQRRAEEKRATLADSKPMEDVLRKILSSATQPLPPILKGLRLSNRYALSEVTTEAKFEDGSFQRSSLKGRPYGDVLKRS